MKVEPAYISIGSNRSSSCSASSSKGLVAYGAGRFLALWDSEDDRGIQETLPGHKGLVTTVKLVQEYPVLKFVSGDSVGAIRIWQQNPASSFRCSAEWDAHPNASISAIAIFPSSQSGSLDQTLMTGASDGLVKVWRIPEPSTSPDLIQTLDLKGKLPLDLELAILPGSEDPVLAMGCTDRRVRLWTKSSDQWSLAIALEGHEDWIRCLSWTAYPSSSSSQIGESSTSPQDLLLASGSQDNYIRLWRVSSVSSSPTSDESGSSTSGGLDLLDEFERKLAGEEAGSVQISTKAHILAIDSKEGTKRYNVTLEALLLGHEAGLTNVHWSPSSPTSSSVLLSTASDNSMIIWTPSESIGSSTAADGIWIPDHRFGNVGGRGLGFFGALWGKDGNRVMAGGWNGGWETWSKEEETGEWTPKAGVVGHGGEVLSVVWEPRGEYLLSVGSDQTTRIHAPCNPSESKASSSRSVWAEIARPQIHGYDMTDAAFLSPYRFASGADEKVTRVFDAPGGFVSSLSSLGIRRQTNGEHVEAVDRPKGATVPPLGLSNRALGKAPQEVEIGGTHVKSTPTDSISQILNDLPTEEELSTSTLWPEIEKIYGHGYEIVAVAASYDGKILATACKATNLEHAAVRLTDTTTWEPLGSPLEGHTLTVTRIAFSPDDEHLLTCSRDRGWRIFSKSPTGTGYESSAGEEKAHSRMVLDCAWGPNGQVFATASRDKTVKLWKRNEEGGLWKSFVSRKFEEGITAVDFTAYQGKVLLAVGSESGLVTIFELSEKESELKDLCTIPSNMSHVSAINRLAWRPQLPGSESGLYLASGSDDRSVRIFEIVAI